MRQLHSLKVKLRSAGSLCFGSDGGYSIAAGDFNNHKAPDPAIPIQNYGQFAILLNTLVSTRPA